MLVLRPFIALTLMVAILAMSFKEWTVIGAFKLHQKEIATKFCMNKFKESCCEGSCFLTNLLIDSNEDQKTSQVILENDRTPLFFSLETESTRRFTSLANRDVLHYGTWLDRPYHPAILDPPRV